MVDQKGIVYYAFIDNQTKVKKQPYIFLFAHKYNWTTSTIQPAIDFPTIKPQTGYVNKQFKFQVLATGKNLVFSDETDLFNISSKGNIGFIPTNESIGEHKIMIVVENDKKQTDFEIMDLVIKK